MLLNDVTALICVHSRVNPVEHIYAAFPMFLYLNASIGGALLRPLLETQAGLTGQSFAAMDIGSAYPAAPGPEPAPEKGVERKCQFSLFYTVCYAMTGVTFASL